MLENSKKKTKLSSQNFVAPPSKLPGGGGGGDEQASSSHRKGVDNDCEAARRERRAGMKANPLTSVA